MMSAVEDTTQTQSRTQTQTQTLHKKKNFSSLHVPVGFVHRRMKQHGKRVSKNAAVAVAAVLEFVTTELMTSSFDRASFKKRQRISPYHVQYILDNNKDLRLMLPGNIVHYTNNHITKQTSKATTTSPVVTVV